MDKENERIFLEKIKKAGNPENYETSWNEKGLPTSKLKLNIRRGKSARAQGSQFELKVRENLELQNWIVDKWTNNFDLEQGKIIPAKRKYNPFKKVLVIGTGFPDFIAIKHLENNLYRIVGVEVKMNGSLSKIEKEKCREYLKKKVFSEIWIAKKDKEKNKVKIVYENFSERYSL